MSVDVNIRQDRPTYGSWYVSLAERVLSLAGPSPEAKEAKSEAWRRAFEKAEAGASSALEERKDAAMRYGRSGRHFRAAEAKHRKARAAAEKAGAVYRQEKFRAAVDFLGWELDEFDVIAFSQFMALLAFGINALATIPIFMLYGAASLIYTIPFLFIVPLVILGYLATYPEALAQRVRVLSLGRAPEAVNYMIMSMRLSPTLDRAVAFTAENADEPLAGEFRRVSWELMMRKYYRIEDALMDMASRWGQWNEDFRRSLYAIRSATLERTDEGMKRALDKASEIILTGTKSRMEAYANSLSGPTMMVFALGVLLPLIIGSMMPMLSMNMGNIMAFDGSDISADTLGAQAAAGSADILPIIIVMDVVFPFVTLAYAHRTLGSRPGTVSPPSVPSHIAPARRRGLALGGLAIAAVICAFGLPPVYGAVGFTALTVTPIIIGIAVGASFYLLATSRRQKLRRDDIKKLEEEFPDALFQLGSRIAEGEPPESAFQKVADSLKGTRVAELFSTVSYNLKMTRAPLEEVLFNPQKGVLADVPSRTVRASMQTVVESVRKDASTAGRIIVGVSSYLRDMGQVERDIDNSLSPVVDMMRTTAVFFAPIVMGITIALYHMLYGQFRELPFTAAMIGPDAFTLIMGVYLLLIVAVTGYFAVGIKNGRDPVQTRYTIGYSLPVAALTFTAVSVLSRSFMGG